MPITQLSPEKTKLFREKIVPLKKTLNEIAVRIDRVLGTQIKPFVNNIRLNTTPEELELIRDHLKAYRQKLRDKNHPAAKFVSLLTNRINIVLGKAEFLDDTHLLGELRSMKDPHIERHERSKIMEEGITKGVPKSQIIYALADHLRKIACSVCSECGGTNIQCKCKDCGNEWA